MFSCRESSFGKYLNARIINIGRGSDVSMQLNLLLVIIYDAFGFMIQYFYICIYLKTINQHVYVRQWK